MVYLSYVGCSEYCKGGSSNYLVCSPLSFRSLFNISPHLNQYSASIDSFIEYSKSGVNNLETAISNATKYLPIFFDSKSANSGFLCYGCCGSEKGYKNSYGIGYNNISNIGMHHIDIFSPDLFLNEKRPYSQFIGSAEEIKKYIIEAFEKTTGREFPADILIKIVDNNELKELHEEFGGKWSYGLQGFSINKKGFGNSLIIVKENNLDRLMVTIGHEIGHVINFPLAEKLNEEAKAFAFEMEWLKVLFSYNIANLRNSINLNPEPANNGLHDVAFNFVKKQILLGKRPFQIIEDLMKNKISVDDKNTWV